MSAEIIETTADEAAEAAMEVAEETAVLEEVIAEEVALAEAEAEVEVVAEAIAEAEAEEELEESTEVVVSSTPAVTPTSIADLAPKMKVNGTVKRVDLYGAIIDLGIDATALIHISKLGTEQVNRVSDVLKEGDAIQAWVEKVDPERQQVMLTLVEPLAVDWGDLKEGQTYTGTITRLENFGAFVTIGAEREGLVHISELSHDYVKSPGEVVSVGDIVTVKVLGFNRRKRRIDLSMKALIERPVSNTNAGGGNSGGGRNNSRSNAPEPVADFDDVEEEYEELPTAMEIALRRALGNEGVSSIKAEQSAGNKQKKQSTTKRQMQQEVIERIMQMTSEN